MTTQRDIAVERLANFTLWLQQMGIVDNKHEAWLRQELIETMDYYIDDKALTPEQRAEYDR